MTDLFDVNPVMASAEETVARTPEFRPSAKKGKNGVFEAVVRFLPNPENPMEKSIIKKWTAFLKNPLTNEQHAVDMPCTVGAPDPIQETFFGLLNSDDPVLKSNADGFKRSLRVASLVQVLKCDCQPDLVNKILVWNYGTVVHTKIDNEMHPPVGAPKNPFNMLVGRPFYVKVVEKNRYNNFDQCTFFDATGDVDCVKIPVENNGVTQYVAVNSKNIQNETFKQMVTTYFNDNCPSMKEYEYNEWSKETREFVNTCISIACNPHQAIQQQNSFVAQPQNVQPSAPAAKPIVTNVTTNPIADTNPGFTIGASVEPQQTQTNGFASSNIPTGLDDILGVQTPQQKPQQTQSTPTTGVDLKDVLGEIM